MDKNVVLEKLEQMSTEFEKQLAEGQKTIADATGKISLVEDELKEAKGMIKTLEDAISKRKWQDMPGVEDEKEKFSIFKTVNAIITNDWSSAQFEKDVMNETRKKALATSTDSAGGFLVPMQAIQDMIELIRAETVVREIGATVMDGLTGIPVEIPKQTGGSTTYWVGENTTISPSDLTFGQLAMNPHTVAALVKLSNRLVRMSIPAAEQIVRNDIATNMALTADLAALRGTGVNGQPLGLRNTPGLNTVDWNLSSPYQTNPGYEQFYDMEYELATANTLKGKLGFLFHPTLRRALAKIRVDQGGGANTGQFLANPVTDPQLESYLGYPFKRTTQIPTNVGTGANKTEVYFGNWSDMIIAMWGGMEILASQETSDAFAKNQTWVRIMMDMDIGIRHIESFVVGVDVTPNLTVI